MTKFQYLKHRIKDVIKGPELVWEPHYYGRIESGKWINRYLDLAKLISTWSKDPSTQCGAVLVRPDKTIASIGFNGLARGVVDREEWLNNRDIKYQTIIHAEENVFDNCKDADMYNYSLFLYPFMPCAHCASRIVNNQVSYVYAPVTPVDKLERWAASFKLSKQIFEDGNVLLTQIGEENAEDY